MIGAALREARERKGMTQEALALATGIDRSYISDIERGEASPTVDRFVRLARAMGVRASALLAKAERAEREAR